jgi:hypothetical protein
MSSAALLGMTIDSKLRWHLHIEGVCTKLARVIFLLQRVRNHLIEKYLVNVYYGLFHSRLSYGLELWAHAVDAGKVRILQKIALLALTGSRPRDHCRPIFERLKILTIYGQYILLSLIYVKQNIANIHVRADVHNHHTRNTSVGATLLTADHN